MLIAAIVLAAGKGTRMKGALPKVLHSVLDRPMVSWVIDAVSAAGVGDIVVVIGHGKERVLAHLQSAHPTVRTVEQKEQKGTGHAVQVALPDVRADSVLVVCGDTPRLDAQALRALCAAQRDHKAPVAMWTTTLAVPFGYGRIVRDDDGAVTAIVEEKDASPALRALTEVNPGVYCIDRAFLERALSSLRTDNAAGELYLTDVVAQAAAASSTSGGVVAVSVPAEMTLGVNDREHLADACAWARRARVRQLRLGGVSIPDDAGVAIGANVTVGEDTTIAAGVSITGKTTIGARVIVGQGCVINACTIADDVVIHPYSVCDTAAVQQGAIIGPFARLRPEANVGEGAHVGNFVELKKTNLGKGSKANHLAYLGDAVIGAGVNVGAGTITCNYDGHGKHKTTIEDSVFVGSNSTLVAPVVLGEGSYVAAGSVVTDDVSKDAVAFGRARQSEKAGHAKVVRERNKARAGK